MVDPTKGIGSLQNLISGTRVTQSDDVKRKEKDSVKDASEKRDEVRLSEKALSLSQAQDTSEQVRSYLSQDTSQSLGNGSNFDETL